MQPLPRQCALQAADRLRLVGRPRQAEGGDRALGAAQPQAERRRRRASWPRPSTARWGGTPRVIDPFPGPKVAEEPRRPAPVRSPAPLDVRLAEGSRWATSADFQGPLAVLGRARARFGAGVATFDADGDGKLDLYLTAAVVGPEGGPRCAPAQPRGRRSSRTLALAFGLPEDRASLGVAAGDFDADRKVDLFLTGVGDNRLYRNLGQDVRRRHRATRASPARAAISLSARWLDLDQDGDLDLYVVNYTELADAEAAFAGTEPPPGRANAAYRNDGKPAPIAGTAAGQLGPPGGRPRRPPRDRRPLDRLLALARRRGALRGRCRHTRRWPRSTSTTTATSTSSSGPTARSPGAVLNDRLGRFHAVEMDDLPTPEPVSGAARRPTSTRTAAPTSSPSARRGGSPPPGTRPSGPPPIDRSPGNPGRPTPRTGGRPSPPTSTSTPGPTCVGLPASGDARLGRLGPERRQAADAEPARAPARRRRAARARRVRPGRPRRRPAPRPRPGRRRRRAPARAQPGQRAALAVARPGGPVEDQLRPHADQPARARGPARRSKGRGSTSRTTTRPRRRASRSRSGRSSSGSARTRSAALLRLRWPDGTMQCELNVAADQTLALDRAQPQDRQLPRPLHLGRRAVRLPGRLPRRRRARLPRRPRRLRPARPRRGRRHRPRPAQAGRRRLPPRRSPSRWTRSPTSTSSTWRWSTGRPGVTTAPDERFAPEGPRPTGEILAWRTADRAGRRDRPEGPRRDRDAPRPRPQDRRRLPAAPRLDRLRRGARHRPRLRRPPERASAPTIAWSSAWPAGSNTPTRRPTTPRARPASRSARRRSNGSATTGPGR